MQRPCKRLKFENVPIVVLLLLLVHTRIASLTDYSKVGHWRTQNGVRKCWRIDHWRTQNGVRKCWRIGFPVVINSRKAEGKVSSTSGNTLEVSLTQHFSRSVTMSFLCFATNCVLVLAFSFSSFEASVHVFVYVRIQAKNSNGTAMRAFLNFNLLRSHCTLLLFPSTLTSFCTPAIIYVVIKFSNVRKLKPLLYIASKDCLWSFLSTTIANSYLWREFEYIRNVIIHLLC